MKLPAKITILLFGTATLFILIVSSYFYTQINQNFDRQAEAKMKQGDALIQQRIEFMKTALKSEMDRLASSLFTENEATLAAMLSTSPDFTTDVINYAERLRRRSTLSFLYVISEEGTILSNSEQPAAFNAPDKLSTFPAEVPAFVLDGEVRLEFRKTARFGSHTLYLRGGYFLKPEMQKLPTGDIGVEVVELNPLQQVTVPAINSNAVDLVHTFDLNDYMDRPVARIVVRISRQDLMDQRDRLVRDSIIFIAGALLVCLLAGYILSVLISRPVAKLRDAAQEMASGNLAVRVESGAGGEIGELVRAFNGMAEQLQEQQAKLVQTERIAAWQEIARHLAHEIKNPLTPIRTSIANLRLSMEKAPQKFPEIFLESSESIQEEVEKLRHLADEFSRFARLPAPQKRTGKINEIIEKSILLYPETRIEFQAGSIPEFSFDPEQLSEVIHNLLQNAVDALGKDGIIKISTSAHEHQERVWVFLDVEDNGQGMAEEVRKQIFTPYFTTKTKGTGLGLAIVHRIISEHGGNIFVESTPGKGTKFEIRLPA